MNTAQASAWHAEGPMVQDISLNGQWDFAYSPQLSLTEPLLDTVMHGWPTPIVPHESAFAASIKVPGYWDDQWESLKEASWWSQARFNPDYQPIEFEKRLSTYPDASSPYLYGVGWYRRRLEVPADWRGRTVTVTVGGAIRECYLYVNRSYVGRHLGSSTPFQLDLTNHVRYGDRNELMIAVSNLDRNVFSMALQGYQGFSAGIFRGVDLHVTGGPGRIHSLFLRPVKDFSMSRWWVDLKASHGTSNQPTQLRWRVRSLDGEVLSEGNVPVRSLDAGELYHVEWDVPTRGLRSWSPWDPQRYVRIQ